MFESHQQSLADLKAQLQEQEQLHGSEVELHDHLAQKACQLEMLLTQLELLEKDLKKLDGFGLSGLFSALSGNRDEKRRQLLNQFREAEKNSLQAQQELEQLQQQLADLQNQLGSQQQLRQDYEQVLNSRLERLRESDSPVHADLVELEQRLEAVKGEQRGMEKTLEIVEETLRSLHTAKLVMGKLKHNHMQRGAVLAGAYNALMAQAGNPAYDNLTSGLRRLHRQLSDLHCSGNEDFDQHLVSFCAQVQQHYIQLEDLGKQGLTDLSVVFGIEDELGMTRDVLRERTDYLQQERRQLEQQRQRLVEEQ
ncbi:MAG: hypothetical protein HJJLKODD_00037 [Phycisphaerae bacterium]|nr:hypothetical protein [Phycisphaerae bacterium]